MIDIDGTVGFAVTNRHDALIGHFDFGGSAVVKRRIEYLLRLAASARKRHVVGTEIKIELLCHIK